MNIIRGRLRGRWRARRLLMKHLNWRQRFSYRLRRKIAVVGSRGGKYRVGTRVWDKRRRRWLGLWLRPIPMIRRNAFGQRYLSEPRGTLWLPQADFVLSVKLALETEELYVRGMACSMAYADPDHAALSIGWMIVKAALSAGGITAVVLTWLT